MSEIIEGRNPVLEALKASHPINKLLVAAGVDRSAVTEILQLAEAKQIPVEYLPRQDLDRQSPSGAHQGVIAHAAAADYVALEDLLEIPAQKGEVPLYLVLDGIEDPQNLGAMLRTAEATGVHGVVLRSHRAVGLTSTVAKTSAGAIWYVPVAQVSSIPQALQTLKKHDIWVIGIELSGKMDYTQADYRLPTAIVIGSEGKGLSELVKERCDFLASIPMHGRITSLNASVAAALVMYEAFRQRKSSPTSPRAE